MLTTLIALRKKCALVSLPLDLNITAGDISLKAIEIYDELLTQIHPLLDEQGIRLSWKRKIWDASSTDTTASIVDGWFRESIGSEEYLVLISAFSGETAQYFEKHERSFQHIAERLHDKPSTILWIEPNWGKSISLFKKIKSMFKLMPWFRDEGLHSEAAEFKWHHPIKKNVIPRGTILVKKYSHR